MLIQQVWNQLASLQDVQIFLLSLGVFGQA